MTNVELIGGYDDLISDASLPREDVDTIARTLQQWGGSAHELTIWLPDWLAEQKDLDGILVEDSSRVIKGICDTDTEKAWCIKRRHVAKDAVWIPKSVGRAFRRECSTSTITIPTSGGGSA